MVFFTLFFPENNVLLCLTILHMILSFKSSMMRIGLIFNMDLVVFVRALCSPFYASQELKNALREDTVDYSTYTANIKRKRPTPRKIGKSGRMVGVNDDPDEDDEDWGGGARSIYRGGRKGSSSTSRQRF